MLPLQYVQGLVKELASFLQEDGGELGGECVWRGFLLIEHGISKSICSLFPAKDLGQEDL